MIIPLILMPYVSRVLGADILGIYNYTYTIAAYFLLFAMLGVANHGCRSVAKVQDDVEKRSYVFCSIYLMQVCVSLIVLVFYIIYVIAFVENNKAVALIQILVVLSGMFDINWFYFGIEKFKLTVTRNILIKLLTTCLIFIFVKSSNDLLLYTFIYAAGLLFSQSIVWIFLKKYVRFKRVKIKDSIENLKPMLVLFIPIVAVSLYKYMDKIMLGFFCEYSQVAFYSNSESIISMPAVITTALGTVALPRLTSLIQKEKKNISEYYLEVSLQFSMFLACGMGFGLGAISDIFAQLYFGPGFEECGNIILVFFPCVIFQAWASIIRMQFLLPNSHDRVYIISVISGAIVNFVINLMLIPSLQALGAVIGTILAEATVAVMQTIFSTKYLPIVKYLKTTIPYAIIGFFMFLLIDKLKLFIGSSIFSLIILIFIGGIFYTVFSILINWRIKTSFFSCFIQEIHKLFKIKKIVHRK